MKYFFVLIFLSCSSTEVTQKKNLVFIHGAHFDGTSWDMVRSHLNDKYETIALTLPGRDQNKDVSLSNLAEDACLKVQRKSIMIGHSQGGAVIHQMLGQCADKVESIIYLTAVVPLPGDKAFDQLDKRDEKWYFQGVEYKNGVMKIKDEVTFFKGFAQDSNESQRSQTRTFDEPARIGEGAVMFDMNKFNDIEKCYIMAKNDRIITVLTQRKYLKRVEFQKVLTLNSSHLPMLSIPRKTAQVIDSCLS